METRIQSLLDAQWDALESRNKNVKVIRQQIGEALAELATKLAEDLSTVIESIKSDSRAHAKVQKNRERREELEKALESEQQCEAAARSKELGGQIAEIDEKILELRKQRAVLDEQLREANAILASRTAKYRDAIEDLDREVPPDQYKTIDEVASRIADKERKQKKWTAELDAANAGMELWENVCSELQSLDSEIKGLTRDQLPRISFALEKASSTVEGLLEVASQAGWSALIVAIGHELQVLHDTQAAVHDAIQGASIKGD